MSCIDERCLKNCRFYLFGSNRGEWEEERLPFKVDRPPTDRELAICQERVSIVQGYKLQDLIAAVSRGYERLVRGFFRKTNTSHEIYLGGSRGASEIPPRPCSDYDFRVVPLDRDILNDSEALLWEMKYFTCKYFDLPYYVQAFVGELKKPDLSRLVFSTEQSRV